MAPQAIARDRNVNWKAELKFLVVLALIYA